MGAKHQTQERIDWDKVKRLQALGLEPAQIRERLGIKGNSMRPQKRKRPPRSKAQ